MPCYSFKYQWFSRVFYYLKLRRLVLLGILAFLIFSLNKAQAKDYHILALGDSLTAGYGLNPGQSFADHLQTALQAELTDRIIIENAGVSGDTTRGGLERLDWLLSNNSYDLVIVGLGANDALRGLDPLASKDNLLAIITKLQEDPKRIILLSGMLAPPNMGSEYGNLFKQLYPEIAKEKQIALYPFFLEGVAGNASLNQKDGIHPTEEGIKIMVNNMLPCIKSLIETSIPHQSCAIPQ